MSTLPAQRLPPRIQFTGTGPGVATVTFPCSLRELSQSVARAILGASR
jgi:hypothetical protein